MSITNNKFGGSVAGGHRVKGNVTPCATQEECDSIDNLLWVQEVVRNNNDTNVQASSLTPDLNTTSYLGYSDYRRVWGPKTHDDSESNRFVANLTYSLGSLKLKLGAQGRDGWSRGSSNSTQVYNENIMGSGSYNENTFGLVYLNASYAINPLSYIKVAVSQQAYETETTNERHGDVLNSYGLRSTDLSSPYYYWRRNGYGNSSAQLGGLLGQSSYGYQYASYY